MIVRLFSSKRLTHKKWDKDKRLSPYLHLKDDRNECLRLVNVIHQSHPELEDYLFDIYRLNGLAYELMYLDSKIVTQVMLQAVKDKVVVLPVHDELIAEGKHQDYLLELMFDAYQEVMEGYLTDKQSISLADFEHYLVSVMPPLVTA